MLRLLTIDAQLAAKTAVFDIFWSDVRRSSRRWRLQLTMDTGIERHAYTHKKIHRCIYARTNSLHIEHTTFLIGRLCGVTIPWGEVQSYFHWPMHDFIHRLCAHSVTSVTRKKISDTGETVFDKYASLRLFNGQFVRHGPHSGNKIWSRCLQIWTEWLLDFG